MADTSVSSALFFFFGLKKKQKKNKLSNYFPYGCCSFSGPCRLLCAPVRSLRVFFVAVGFRSELPEACVWVLIASEAVFLAGGLCFCCWPTDELRRHLHTGLWPWIEARERESEKKKCNSREITQTFFSLSLSPSPPPTTTSKTFQFFWLLFFWK